MIVTREVVETGEEMIAGVADHVMIAEVVVIVIIAAAAEEVVAANAGTGEINLYNIQGALFGKPTECTL